MKRAFIRLSGDVIDQVLEYDGPEAMDRPGPDGMIELTGAALERSVEDLILHTYNAQQGTFTPPSPPPLSVRLSRLEFRQLFTAAERSAIRTLVRDEDDEVTDAWEAMQMAEYVDIADPRVAGYLTLLVSKAVIDNARKAQILAGQVPQ